MKKFLRWLKNCFGFRRPVKKPVYVEVVISSPRTKRVININAVRVEPQASNEYEGSLEMFFSVEPPIPENEKPADRNEAEDLMHHILNSLAKGLHS